MVSNPTFCLIPGLLNRPLRKRLKILQFSVFVILSRRQFLNVKNRSKICISLFDCPTLQNFLTDLHTVFAKLCAVSREGFSKKCNFHSSYPLNHSLVVRLCICLHFSFKRNALLHLTPMAAIRWLFSIECITCNQDN